MGDIVRQSFVEMLNAIDSQIYAFSALVLGVLLVITHNDIGKELIVGAFALLRTGKGKSSE